MQFWSAFVDQNEKPILVIRFLTIYISLMDDMTSDHDAILKALAHPVRRDMLAWLKEPERHFSAQAHPLEMGVCAGSFERCGLSQSTVSAHLAVLSSAGLVTSRKIGPFVFYSRDEVAIAAFRTSLANL